MYIGLPVLADFLLSISAIAFKVSSEYTTPVGLFGVFIITAFVLFVIFCSKEAISGWNVDVSDNTGTTNGGSDNLITTGYRVKNTKAGDIEVTETTLSRKPIGCLSSEVNFEIFN